PRPTGWASTRAPCCATCSAIPTTGWRACRSPERSPSFDERSARLLFLLLLLEDLGDRASALGIGVPDDAVGRSPLVVLGQVLRDGKALRVHEEQAVAVLVLLHLVAGADPAAELRLFLRIRIEVAGTERPPHLLDVPRQAVDDGLGDAP